MLDKNAMTDFFLCTPPPHLTPFQLLSSTSPLLTQPNPPPNKYQSGFVLSQSFIHPSTLFKWYRTWYYLFRLNPPDGFSSFPQEKKNGLIAFWNLVFQYCGLHNVVTFKNSNRSWQVTVLRWNLLCRNKLCGIWNQ